MKKNFFTGLIILLPIALTLLIVAFVIKLLTAPFLGIAEAFLSSIFSFQGSFLVFSGSQMLTLAGIFTALAALTASVLILGFFGQMVIGRRILRLTDRFIRRIPVINKLYASMQEGIKTLFKSSNSSFSQVVLVPFPHPKALCVAFLSEKQPLDIEKGSLAVFMPGVAMHSMGLMTIYRREEVIYLDMKVEDAIKLLVSYGTIAEDLKRVK